MKHKTKLLVDRFTEILTAWEGVECITLNEAAHSDPLDPYFALILDVFYSSPIPKAQKRCSLYGEDVAVFETSSQNEKDRFLIGDTPVRLEYKKTGKIDDLVHIACDKHESLWFIKDAGTYGFYRLANCDIIFSRSNWIHDVRKRLKSIDERFWKEMRDTVQSKMEHFISDLGAACFQGDKFHYLIASAGFIKMACLTLFCINKHFEPSHRAYFKQVCELPVLPGSFLAEFQTFLDNRNTTDMESNFYLAKLIGQKITAL
ncbi:MAG: DUF4037 domain-containing protein [Treponema sp.]|jgi:hypothetical protein|nr:DUF4037 domain-containing protein [Treponema sp.]